MKVDIEHRLTDEEIQAEISKFNYSHCLAGRSPYEYQESYNSVCRPWLCPKCGFYPTEVKHRRDLMIENGLTKAAGGHEYLKIIRR